MDNGFFPIKSERDKRNKLVRSVEPGWSHRFNELIWNEKRLPCAWSFKRARVRSELNDIYITGKCKECAASVSAFYSFSTRTIKVTINGSDQSVIHKMKRHMTVGLKTEVRKMLDGNSAFSVRSKLADKAMEAGDCIPAHVPNLAALHQIKARGMPVKHKNPIQSLKLMKNGPFRGEIHEIGLDPFYVSYCTPLQSHWYNSEPSRITYVDASGMPGMRKLDSCEAKSSLLYVMSAKGI